jgi:hypothetical protein
MDDRLRAVVRSVDDSDVVGGSPQASEGRSAGLVCLGAEAYSVLVYDRKESTVAAFVEIEEIGVGWPMWDFTDWECWGMRFGLGWTCRHIPEGVGEIDVRGYRLALLIGLSRPSAFVRSTREQIINTVKHQDLSLLDLEALY